MAVCDEWILHRFLSSLQNEAEKEWVVRRFEEAAAQQFTQERKRETLIKLAQSQVSTTAPIGINRLLNIASLYPPLPSLPLPLPSPLSPLPPPLPLSLPPLLLPLPSPSPPPPSPLPPTSSLPPPSHSLSFPRRLISSLPSGTNTLSATVEKEQKQ